MWPPGGRHLSRALLRCGTVVALVVSTAVVLRLAYGRPSTSPDGLHSLVWGAALARGDLPSYELGPTPHPLGILAAAGLRLAFGDAVRAAAEHLALLNWAVVLGLLFLLGRHLGGLLAGVLAAVLAATTTGYVVLVLGASQDLAGITLLLVALLLVVQGRPALAVSAVLGLAGLLRPEYWLLAGLHALWTLARHRSRSAVLQLGLVLVAPVLWCLSDWVVTGQPLHSLLYTRELAADLGRTRGLLHAPLAYVRGHAVLAGPAVVLAAPAGLVLLLRDRPRGTAEVVGVLVVGVLSYVLIGLSGLSLIERYALASSVVLTLLAAVAAAHALRAVRSRTSPTGAGAVAGLLAVLLAGHAVRALEIERARTAIAERDRLLTQLEAWRPELRSCPPVHLPAVRSVVPPALALLLGRDLADLPLARPGDADAGTYLSLADAERFGLGTGLVPAPPGRTLASSTVGALVGVRCPQPVPP